VVVVEELKLVDEEVLPLVVEVRTVPMPTTNRKALHLLKKMIN
jgi:hypothetical protein